MDQEDLTVERARLLSAGRGQSKNSDGSDKLIKIKAKRTILPRAYVTSNNNNSMALKSRDLFSTVNSDNDEEVWAPATISPSDLTPWPGDLSFTHKSSKKQRPLMLTRYGDESLSPKT